jgi:hypothetical protein
VGVFAISCSPCVKREIDKEMNACRVGLLILRADDIRAITTSPGENDTILTDPSSAFLLKRDLRNSHQASHIGARFDRELTTPRATVATKIRPHHLIHSTRS